MLFSCTLNVQLTVEHEQVRFNNECVSNLFQAPEGVPAFQFYTTFQWELRRRVLRLFQQAAHKVQSSIYCKVSEVHEQVHTSMSICSMHRSHTHPSGEGCYTSACPFCLAMCSSNVSSLQYSQFSCVRCVTVKVKKCSIVHSMTLMFFFSYCYADLVVCFGSSCWKNNPRAIVQFLGQILTDGNPFFHNQCLEFITIFVVFVHPPLED